MSDLASPRLGLAEPLPETGEPLAAAMDAAMAVLDRSIAQSRPRFFGFVGGSGLESGVLADALAESFDINMAAWAALATDLEPQAIGWLADFRTTDEDVEALVREVLSVGERLARDA